MSHGTPRDRTPVDVLPIGEFARRSGLSVSALRFYDREGVLRPEAVDAATGYRRYAPHQVRVARMVAGMRRVGMPVVEIREAAEHAADTELVADLLERHLNRLESGLADARREITRLRSALTRPEDAIVRVRSADLRRLITAVAFAQSDDPDMPILTGALLEIEPETIRLVATDRYRLAVHGVPADSTGCRSGVVPAEFLAAVLEALIRTDSGDEVVVTLCGPRVCADIGGHAVEHDLIDGDYPDYRRLISREQTADLAWAAEPARVDDPEPGLATLSGSDEPVVVRHEFLLEALAAAGPEATLGLDGPIRPLVVQAADGALSLLMPTRAAREDGRP